MKAGFSYRDITPVIGMERPGGYGKVFVTEIHDPLKVRASVFSDGKEKAAFVGIDAGAVLNRASNAIRAEIEKTCGIKKEYVAIGASHTHSGGPFIGPLPEDYDDAPKELREMFLNNSIVTDPFYFKHIVNQTISAIREADHNLQNVQVLVGSGHEDKASYNRRFIMKNGRMCTHPGKGNPNIVKPAGPIDPEVGVIGAFTPRGELSGCIVNFACHGTTMNDGASADWIYYLEKTIQGVYGRDMVVVFLNGPSGDITQVNNLSLDAGELGERSARNVGQRVGAEALKVLATAYPGELTPIKALSKVIPLNKRKPSQERVKKCWEIVRKHPIKTMEWQLAKEIIALDYLLRKEPVFNAEIQAIQMGPAVFITNPVELFCQYGLEIKKKSRFPLTYIAQLVNGFSAYVPTREAFDPQTGGGYETTMNTYINLEVGAGEKIVKTSLALANQLKPGKMPEGPKVKPAKEEWSYGVLGPDLE